jgi:hypothetical protein
MADQAFRLDACRLDMTMMYAMHDALRRELERIARITARPDDDPRHVLGTAVGWEIFKTYLRVHHTAEDDAVWPVMYRVLAGRPGSARRVAAGDLPGRACGRGDRLRKVTVYWSRRSRRLRMTRTVTMKMNSTAAPI